MTCLHFFPKLTHIELLLRCVTKEDCARFELTSSSSYDVSVVVALVDDDSVVEVVDVVDVVDVLDVVNVVVDVVVDVVEAVDGVLC